MQRVDEARGGGLQHGLALAPARRDDRQVVENDLVVHVVQAHAVVRRLVRDDGRAGRGGGRFLDVDLRLGRADQVGGRTAVDLDDAHRVVEAEAREVRVRVGPTTGSELHERDLLPPSVHRGIDQVVDAVHGADLIRSPKRPAGKVARARAGLRPGMRDCTRSSGGVHRPPARCDVEVVVESDGVGQADDRRDPADETPRDQRGGCRRVTDPSPGEAQARERDTERTRDRRCGSGRLYGESSNARIEQALPVKPRGDAADVRAARPELASELVRCEPLLVEGRGRVVERVEPCGERHRIRRLEHDVDRQYLGCGQLTETRRAHRDRRRPGGHSDRAGRRGRIGRGRGCGDDRQRHQRNERAPHLGPDFGGNDLMPSNMSA